MLNIVRGSLLDQDVECIVNAANEHLRGGGGIDGRIHFAAGPELLEDLTQSWPDGINTGEAVLTPGFNLKQPYIIHTPGPIWMGGLEKEVFLLANCYRNSLELAATCGIKKIAFCSISTGIYGFPLELAAPIALTTILEFIKENPFMDVTFALFGEEEYEVFMNYMEDINNEPTC